MPIFVVDTNRTELFGAALPTPNPHTMAAYATHIYEGCEFGCAYCSGWSQPRPLNESVRLVAEIAHKAHTELASMPRQHVVGLTEISDPYQPAEQQYRRTRAVLRVLAEYAQPVTIMTKSQHVLDDAELLVHIAQRSFAMVIVSVVSHVVAVQQRLEDRCESTMARLDTVYQLKKLGIPVGVALQPLIPYLNDTDYAITQLLGLIAMSGADFVYWDYLVMPNQRHRTRIADTMTRVSEYPPAFLRDIYRDRAQIDATYRQERDAFIVQQCDMLHLPLALPPARYASRVDARQALQICLLQLAYRDRMLSRGVLAAHGAQLAAQVANSDVDGQTFASYAHYSTIHPLLVQAGLVADNTRMV